MNQNGKKGAKKSNIKTKQKHTKQQKWNRTKKTYSPMDGDEQKDKNTFDSFDNEMSSSGNINKLTQKTDREGRLRFLSSFSIFNSHPLACSPKNWNKEINLS